MKGPDPEGSPEPPGLSIEFDMRVYSLETLQKAALKYSRLASFDFRLRDNFMVEVRVEPNGAFELAADQFTALYRTEVLDQHLRSLVADQTAEERNLILHHAFSKTHLIET